MKKFLSVFLVAALAAAAVACGGDDKPLPNPGGNTDPDPEIPDEPEVESIALDRDGTANCYIVGEAGTYSFDATVAGNRAATGTIVPPTLAPASAELLWQDYYADTAGLITQVELQKNGRIIFSTARKYHAGNAVIAARSLDGTILWSWHIWLTEFDPQQNIFITIPNESGTKWTFMDRNLGATSTVPRNTFSFGMLYQWGRKDPFTASADYVKGKERTIWNLEGDALPDFGTRAADGGSIELATANPMTFYTASYENGYRSKDWSEVSDDDRWGGESFKKTIYDPCPPGWKVPVCDAGGGHPYQNVIDYGRWDDFNLGFTLADEIWFPAAGTRVCQTGQVDIQGGVYTGLWIGTKGEANPNLEEFPTLYGQYLVAMQGGTFIGMKDQRSQGMSVRCVKE